MGKQARKEKKPTAGEPPSPGKAEPLDAAIQPPDAEAPAPVRRGYSALLPEAGLLPWWVVLLATCYLLLKMGLSFEHPCSILGVSAPVTRGAISKRYRELSMCTHPDKLLGQPPDDIERGKLLFQRASGARDMLTAAVRDAAAALEAQRQLEASGGDDTAAAADGALAQASCSTQLDEAIWQGLEYMFEAGNEVGAMAMLQYVFDFFYSLCTFQFDLTGTISSVLLLMTFFTQLKSLLSFLRDSGPLSTLIAAFTTVFIGPLPTLYRFAVLPVLRVEAFVRCELLPFFSAEGTAVEDNYFEVEGGPDGSPEQLQAEREAMAMVPSDDGAAATEPADGAAPAPEAAAAAAAAAGEEEVPAEIRAARKRMRDKEAGGGADAPKRGLKLRVKATERAPTKEVIHQKIALSRMLGSMHSWYAVPPLQRPLRELLARRTDPNARIFTADAHQVQFELLLSTSKPVIPLLCLLATGQVYNGIFFSIATSQMLHRLPALRPESQHVLALLVGAMHTLVCAGKSQLMEMEKAPEGLLQLQWDWGVRDVFAIANMLLIGGSFATASCAYNEPPFCASFAAGLALRIVAYEVSPASLGEKLRRLLRGQNLEMVGLDQVAARAGGGVGACGGGPLRAWLGGWGVPALPQLAALACKGALLLLPCLAAAQWGLRAAKAWQRLRREGARQGGGRRIKISGELLAPVLRRRCAAAVAMHVSMLLLVGLVSQYELNGINSQLGTFLVLACVGCLFESLLASYDMRGRVRQFIFFVMFMVL